MTRPRVINLAHLSNDEIDRQVIEREFNRGDSLSPQFSEDRLALNFADRFQSTLRHVAVLGKWLVFDGAHWHVDETQLVRDRARLVCRESSSSCNKELQAKAIASAKTIAAVQQLASADRRIAMVIDQFDSDPWLLNTPAGTFDLRSGECCKHSAGDYITKITGTTPCRLRYGTRSSDGLPMADKSWSSTFSGSRVIL